MELSAENHSVTPAGSGQQRKYSQIKPLNLMKARISHGVLN